MWPMIIGAAIGLLKDREAQGEADRQRKVQAEMTRYSPWTGMMGSAVANPSMLGNVAQGAAVGGSFGQSLKDYNSGDAALKAASNADEVNQANQIAQTKIPAVGSAGHMGGASSPAGGSSWNMMSVYKKKPYSLDLFNQNQDQMAGAY